MPGALTLKRDLRPRIHGADSSDNLDAISFTVSEIDTSIDLKRSFAEDTGCKSTESIYLLIGPQTLFRPAIDIPNAARILSYLEVHNPKSLVAWKKKL